MLLRTSAVANRVIVRNPEAANAVQLYADELTNRVTVYNQVGSNGAAISIKSE